MIENIFTYILCIIALITGVVFLIALISVIHNATKLERIMFTDKDEEQLKDYLCTLDKEVVIDLYLQKSYDMKVLLASMEEDE